MADVALLSLSLTSLSNRLNRVLAVNEGAMSRTSRCCAALHPAPPVWHCAVPARPSGAATVSVTARTDRRALPSVCSAASACVAADVGIAGVALGITDFADGGSRPNPSTLILPPHKGKRRHEMSRVRGACRVSFLDGVSVDLLSNTTMTGDSESRSGDRGCRDAVQVPERS
jgi:hypothetical protein